MKLQLEGEVIIKRIPNPKLIYKGNTLSFNARNILTDLLIPNTPGIQYMSFLTSDAVVPSDIREYPENSDNDTHALKWYNTSSPAYIDFTVPVFTSGANPSTTISNTITRTYSPITIANNAEDGFGKLTITVSIPPETLEEQNVKHILIWEDQPYQSGSRLFSIATLDTPVDINHQFYYLVTYSYILK